MANQKKKKAEIQASVQEPLAPLTRKLSAKELAKLHVELVNLPDRTKLDRYQSPDYPFRFISEVY